MFRIICEYCDHVADFESLLDKPDECPNCSSPFINPNIIELKEDGEDIRQGKLKGVTITHINSGKKLFVPAQSEVILGRESIGSKLFKGIAKVSRRHFLLKFSAHAVTITDLGSTNGTFLGTNQINCKTYPGQALKDSDILLLGNEIFTTDNNYEDYEEEEDETMIEMLNKAKESAENQNLSDEIEKKVQERVNEILAEKKEVEVKNQDMMDSLVYAKRLQQAILPEISDIKNDLDDFFILYLPKDIVSGDFYYYAKKEEKSIIAAADCTGHGVPGAFMSLVANNALNHVINRKGITEPAEVLNSTHDEVVQALKQRKTGSTNDGMDIALLTVDKKAKKLVYSGAHRPLYFIRHNKFKEIKANRQPIGGSAEKYKRVAFDQHEIDYTEGDIFYICSDGYPDQFGGKKDKKYMTKRFKRFLFFIHRSPMEKQKELLKNEIEAWRGETEQTDDILIIGIKL